MSVTQPVVEVPQWTLGERFRKARRIRKIEIKEMAELLGVSRVAISQWETDTARPRDLVGVAQQWADITQVPVSWLLGLGEQQPERPGPKPKSSIRHGAPPTYGSSVQDLVLCPPGLWVPGRSVRPYTPERGGPSPDTSTPTFPQNLARSALFAA